MGLFGKKKDGEGKPSVADRSARSVTRRWQRRKRR